VATGVVPKGLRVNGRGLAAADVDNDGRMAIAINSIGGKLLLLKTNGPVGHWLDVSLSRFSPGAVVTLALADGRTLSQEVRAGSSYLSSEDQRLHFGLGDATRVARLAVRYPGGGESVLHGVRADRIVEVRAPRRHAPPSALHVSYRLPDCKPVGAGGPSIADVWDETAVAALSSSAATDPGQARDPFHRRAPSCNAPG